MGLDLRENLSDLLTWSKERRGSLATRLSEASHELLVCSQEEPDKVCAASARLAIHLIALLAGPKQDAGGVPALPQASLKLALPAGAFIVAAEANERVASLISSLGSGDLPTTTHAETVLKALSLLDGLCEEGLSSSIDKVIAQDRFWSDR